MNLLRPCLCFDNSNSDHTGKCIRRFAGIYAYCRYFIDRKMVDNCVITI